MSNSKENSILKLANNILEVLGQDIVIEEEDYLFNDEFYVTIVSNVVPDNTCNIEVGETETQKIESLVALINFLSSIVEMDLNHINPRGIIEERDEESVRNLLELILELIIILKQEGGEDQNEDQNEEQNEEQFEEQEEENQQNFSASKDDNSQLNYNHYSGTNRSVNLDNLGGKSISGLGASMQENQIEEPSANEADKNSSPTVRIKNDIELRESENLEDSLNFGFRDNKSCPTAKFEEDTSQINYKENYSQNDVTRYEKVISYLANQEMMQDNVNQEIQEDHSGINMNFYSHSMNDDDSKPAVNISRISEVSRSKENSEPHSNQKYLKNTYQITNPQESGIRPTQSKEDKNMEIRDSLAPSNLSLNKRDYIQDEEEEFKLKNTDSMEIQINNREINENKAKAEKNDNKYSKRDPKVCERKQSGKPNSKREIEENSKNNKQMASSYKVDKFEKNQTLPNDDENETRVLKKIKSQKKLINKNSISDLSMSSVSKRSQGSKSNLLNNNTTNLEKNNSHINSLNQTGISKTSKFDDGFIEELPLNEENLKFEIMKEVRRIYGDKFDRIFLKNNIKNSNNMLEMILRNIKVARQKMVKLGLDSSEPDDLITKEFMLKYSKELEYIIKYYQTEEKKRNFLKTKAINNITKNLNVMYKIQEIQSKNIENEIERRRRSRDIKVKHNQIKLCNEIYSKALELEKQKYLEERAYQAEIRKSENLEKRNIMIQIENYYKDKISILKEILRREKYEKEIEHRAKIQFLSQFEREKKATFKKHIDEIFERLDEEDRKSEFQNTNTEQLEKILLNYYKK